jgi:hypothetical protein
METAEWILPSTLAFKTIGNVPERRQCKSSLNNTQALCAVSVYRIYLFCIRISVVFGVGNK